MSEEINAPIVIDAGGWSFKVGFAQDEVPRVILPSAISKVDSNTYLFGRESLSSDESHPIIQAGNVPNYEHLSIYWRMIVEERLGTLIGDKSYLLSYSPITSKITKEKIAHLAFEKLNFPQLMLVSSSLLIMYSTGRTSGMVVDVGHTHSTVVPITDGSPNYLWQSSNNNGGKLIDEFLSNKLNVPILTAHEIKESNARISIDYDRECRDLKDNNTIQLPDGNSLSLGDKGLQAGEILFNGKYENIPGIDYLIYESIEKAESDRPSSDVVSNIIVAGGSSMMNGFVERLQTKLNSMLPTLMKTKIHSYNDRSISAW